MSYNVPSHLIGLNDSEVAVARKKYVYDKRDAVEKGASVKLLQQPVYLSF